ncbi:MAG: hypothetical protein WCI47_00015 [bacterium]
MINYTVIMRPARDIKIGDRISWDTTVTRVIRPRPGDPDRRIKFISSNGTVITTQANCRVPIFID